MNAIYNSPYFEPSFGSKDLLSSGLTIRCKRSSYEMSIRETSNEDIKIEEFEVFRIF
jgi:hypothetical protein